MALLDISYNKLTQVAPDLTKFIVSFKDMSDELATDKDIELGAFILDINGSRYFIPVMNQAGAIFPIDSIYSASLECFLPITKDMVSKILNEVQIEMGKTVSPRITQKIDKNPSVYEFVVPPKTANAGKVASASTKLTESLARMPEMYKKAMTESLLDDLSFARALGGMFDIQEIISALKHQPIVEKRHVLEMPAVQVIEGGESLPHEAIQDILNDGFAILGTPKTTRIATVTEESTIGTTIFTKISAIKDLAPCSLVKKSGELANAVKLPGCLGCLVDGQVAGFLSPQHEALVAIPIESTQNVYREAVSALPTIMPASLCSDSDILVEYQGVPLAVGVHNVMLETSGFISFSSTNVNGTRSTFNCYPSYKGSPTVEGGRVILGMPTFYKTSRGYDAEFENNVNIAQIAKDMRDNALLPEHRDVAYNTGEFYVNGASVGNTPAFVRLMVVHEGLSPDKTRELVKAAKKAKKVKLRMSASMSKEAGTAEEASSVGRQMPDDQPVVSGDPAKFNKNTFQQALETQDREVAESVIITELLQDPNMYDTIGTYLPEIGSTMDKIGRILFLTRLNSGSMSDMLGYNSTTEMLNSLRNVYRLLGDNYVKLERLANNVTSDA